MREAFPSPATLRVGPGVPRVAIPPRLRASVERHQTNLLALVQRCKEAGLTETDIECAVGVIVDSYRAELLEAINDLTADQGAELP